MCALERSRYGFSRDSSRASADAETVEVMRSRFPRLEPTQGRRAHDDLPLLDFRNRGPPEAADVDRLDAGLLESGRRLPRDPRAGLLRQDGELRREGPDRREATLGPAVPFRLHHLL